jgi:hypothetical protein
MNWRIFLGAVFGGFIGMFIYNEIMRLLGFPRRSARPAPRDLRNCALLLAFLQNSFRGAVIGDLRMDDLTQSFKNLLESVWGAEQP